VPNALRAVLIGSKITVNVLEADEKEESEWLIASHILHEFQHATFRNN
jgi:hypothetical protein